MLTLQANAALDGEAGFKVFQWHGETFDIPLTARRLASSAYYPNQAFRFEENAYAFQFHIEVTEAMITEWMLEAGADMDRIEKETSVFYERYKRMAFAFYGKFFGGLPPFTGGERGKRLRP
jgi:hypothetical protein